MKIKIINTSEHPLPSYETIYSAGMDLRANVLEPSTLKPLHCLLFFIAQETALPVQPMWFAASLTLSNAIPLTSTILDLCEL